MAGRSMGLWKLIWHRFKRIGNLRITGVSTPLGGVSWKEPEVSELEDKCTALHMPTAEETARVNAHRQRYKMVQCDLCAGSSVSSVRGRCPRCQGTGVVRVVIIDDQCRP